MMGFCGGDNDDDDRIPLWCPWCGKSHIDEGEFATRPHHTHRCVDDSTGSGCGREWRLDACVFGVHDALTSATWDDAPLPEDDAISAAHPSRTERHDIWATAMRLVGAKRSKGALVALVNWLLVRIDAEKERR